MNFKQFLQERFAEVPSTIMTDKIEIQCEPFLKAVQGKGFLFRGIKNLRAKAKVGDIFDDAPMYHVDVRKDRVPLSMPPQVSAVLDDYFEEKFDVRARSQSAFCYGESEKNAADGYGPIAMVFPIGEFKLIWSPEVDDLWDIFDEVKHDYILEEGREYDTDMIRKWVNSLKYTDKRIAAAVQSKSELMLVCDSYYAVPAQSEYIRAMKEALEFE